MGEITVWVKQIVAVTIIAGFLEMMLPDNRLKGVTKLIMGLMVIMMMIRPVTVLLHLPVEYNGSLENITTASPPHNLQTKTLIERGNKLRREWNGVYRQKYEKVTSQKIKKALNAAGLGRLLRLKLDYRGDDLKRVILTLAPSDATPSSPNIPQTTQVVRLVSAVTDWEEEQIEVIWHVQKH